MTMYESLSKRYREQDNRSVFAHFPWREEQGETWETPFQRLAEKARPEAWNFSRPNRRRQGRDYPILQAYLNHTFLRLQEQGKIRYSSDDSRACLNTGLQTTRGKDIYATFYRNHGALEYNQPDWTLFGFFDAHSDKVSEFEPLPDIASYVDDPADLVFDHRLDVETDYHYILHESGDRLPQVLRGNPALARNALEGAILQLMERLRRNYRLAVPHWYDNRIQLLLPLCIIRDNIADMALVMEKDAARGKYTVRNVISLDMAYINARVLCAPDNPWLTP
ncbi:MAG: DUF3825 domain-containing protein [Cardiobacteriaceae bacterium]|nr:DUF3825 domain-containing protein [Cardiobacteriaceae bacterium]